MDKPIFSIKKLSFSINNRTNSGESNNQIATKDLPSEYEDRDSLKVKDSNDFLIHQVKGQNDKK